MLNIPSKYYSISELKDLNGDVPSELLKSRETFTPHVKVLFDEITGYVEPEEILEEMVEDALSTEDEDVEIPEITEDTNNDFANEEFDYSDFYSEYDFHDDLTIDRAVLYEDDRLTCPIHHRHYTDKIVSIKVSKGYASFKFKACIHCKKIIIPSQICRGFSNRATELGMDFLIVKGD